MSSALQSPASTAHPRSRGENAETCSLNFSEYGSSPLTRGKRLDSVLNRVDAGLIPAHAGKTPSQPSPCTVTPAHPRSRGENRARSSRNRYLRGSSPLTRGKHGHSTHRHRYHGLIPAHAGKTGRCMCGVRRGGAHPRSRGENTYEGSVTFPRAGSSPLTRGKRLIVDRATWAARLIPAHAGKTRLRPARTFGCKAHPRSRGENVLPRLPSALLAWLIPAHAGKTYVGLGIG